MKNLARHGRTETENVQFNVLQLSSNVTALPASDTVLIPPLSQQYLFLFKLRGQGLLISKQAQMRESQRDSSRLFEVEEPSEERLRRRGTERVERGDCMIRPLSFDILLCTTPAMALPVWLCQWKKMG